MQFLTSECTVEKHKNFQNNCAVYKCLLAKNNKNEPVDAGCKTEKNAFLKIQRVRFCLNEVTVNLFFLKGTATLKEIVSKKYVLLPFRISFLVIFCLYNFACLLIRPYNGLFLIKHISLLNLVYSW